MVIKDLELSHPLFSRFREGFKGFGYLRCIIGNYPHDLDNPLWFNNLN